MKNKRFLPTFSVFFCYLDLLDIVKDYPPLKLFLDKNDIDHEEKYHFLELELHHNQMIDISSEFGITVAHYGMRKKVYPLLQMQMEGQITSVINQYYIEKNTPKIEVKKERKKELGYVYVIEANKVYKIGKTINIETRFNNFITDNPYKFNLITNIKVSDYIGVEKRLHKKFKDKLVRGEWFDLSKNDILKINNILEKEKVE